MLRANSQGWARLLRALSGLPGSGLFGRLVVVFWVIALGGMSAGQDLRTREGCEDLGAIGAEGLEEEVGWTDLLSGELQTVWRSYPEGGLGEGEAAAGVRVWHVEADEGGERVLICSGQPRGFLRTEARYGDFELRGEWRYLKDADGNSGILVFTQAEERIWPTSVQIQLHQPKAGSTFPSGDAKTDNVLELETSSARPPGQWNECRIVCRRGTVTIEMNGRRVGEITGARPAEGHLALQSEGAEVHFRRLRIRRLRE